jgi:hypothetical protein
MTDSSVPPNSASRKHPTTNLARGIDELDAVGSLAIAKRSSRAPHADQTKRKTSPSTATLDAATKSSESSAKSVSKSGGLEVNDSLRQSSQASRPSRVTARPRPSARPQPELSIWPQWLFAAAVLGAALWYLFSAEPPSRNRDVRVDPKVVAPKR